MLLALNLLVVLAGFLVSIIGMITRNNQLGYAGAMVMFLSMALCLVITLPLWARKTREERMIINPPVEP